MNVALVVVAVAAAWMVSGVALAAALGPRLRRCAEVVSNVADDATSGLNRRTVETFRWILPSSVVVLALTSSTGLAAAGVLPGPAQFVAHSVLGTVGLDVPDVPDHTTGEADVEAAVAPEATRAVAAPSGPAPTAPAGAPLPLPAGDDDRASSSTDDADVIDVLPGDLPAEDLDVGDEAPVDDVPQPTSQSAQPIEPRDEAHTVAPIVVPSEPVEAPSAPEPTTSGEGDDDGDAEDGVDVGADVPPESAAPTDTTTTPPRVALPRPDPAPRPPTTPPPTTPPPTTPPPTTPPPTTPPPTTPPPTVPPPTVPTSPDVTTPDPPAPVTDDDGPTGDVAFEASPDEGQREAAAQQDPPATGSSLADHLAVVEDALASTGAELVSPG